MNNPHNITREFENELCDYTGARYAVAINSCTMAVLLTCRWIFENPDSCRGNVSGSVIIPKRTYVSIPQSIHHAGFRVIFEDIEWQGGYQLSPLPVWDYARRFTRGMYHSGQFQCVSFHSAKILGDTQGGAILHDNPDADAWFRKARFDGRTEGVHPGNDHFDMIGWHCYMSPDVAARLRLKLQTLPAHNPDIPLDDYPDLSQFEVFRR